MNSVAVVGQDYLGFLADVTELLEQNDINILGIDARHYGDMAKLNIETCDNQAALHILLQQGYKAFPKQTAVINVPNQPGYLARITRSLAQADIDLRQIRHISHTDASMKLALTTSDDSQTRLLLQEWLVQ